jgi:NADPH:quinone reductase-like Zn-dependent oxidoreductase
MVQTRYGPPDEVLALREIDTPVVGDDDVLVRVHAAALHIGDVFGVRGSPLAMRLATGLAKPRPGIPGFDLAGEVEAVGGNVTQFRPGDAVFGAGKGTCAEYASVKQDTLAPKPATLTFAEAAALPTSALAALHALRDVGKVRPGQTVLINGAAGGVGVHAVQIAKAFGAEVTGVCGTANVDLVRSLGANQVIDYTRQDFTRGEQRYDLMLDNVENRPLSEVRRALAPGGTLILNSGTGATGLGMLIRLARPFVVGPITRQRLRRFLSVPKQEDLVVLGDLVDAGKLRPVIDRTYPLRETPAALRYIEGGHARGKVVITLEP